MTNWDTQGQRGTTKGQTWARMGKQGRAMTNSDTHGQTVPNIDKPWQNSNNQGRAWGRQRQTVATHDTVTNFTNTDEHGQTATNCGIP